ncbi:MAG: pyridoxal phosphate-dependent aminotransferase [Eubacteriales bacterium]
MYNAKMHGLGTTRSVIREIFEYGNRRKAEIGADKVFDFSLGNPSVPAPDCVNDTVRKLLDTTDSVTLHGYTSAPGDRGVRQTIADNLNRRFGTAFKADNLYMTVGAAASLTSTLRGLCEAGDQFLVSAPFFPEYRVFVEAVGGELCVIPPKMPSFQLDVDMLERAITPHTKAVLINSPNNPSGVVYTEETVKALADVLKRKSAEKGEPIFLITDEPYRELVYDDATVVPYVTKYYRDTIVCYSFSKSLSLPGERIGYVLVPDEVTDSAGVYAAISGAARALGYVCAPALFQRVVAACAGQTADIEVYRVNRDLLYNSLTAYGFDCVYPDGAFYLFMKSPEPDAGAFCQRAKKYELLLVPADDFGTPGYVRISYCVSTDMIRRSLPAFEALAKEYQN